MDSINAPRHAVVVKRWPRLPHTKPHPRFVAHHVYRPRGIPHDFNVYFIDAVDPEDRLTGKVNNRTGERAAHRGEGDLCVDFSSFDLDGIDETEIGDRKVQLGVIDGTEGVKDLLFGGHCSLDSLAERGEDCCGSECF